MCRRSRDRAVRVSKHPARGNPVSEQATVWTVGHSTRTWEEFVAILREFSIETVCDIRAWPSSRKFPHFNGEAMRAALARESIAYRWMGEALGGHRKKGLGAASPNKALRSLGFRNYADHMQSESFRRALDDLEALASRSQTAVMCAETLHFRCHRWLLSDALVSRDVRVIHIKSRSEFGEHRLSGGVEVVEGMVTYPGENDLFQ